MKKLALSTLALGAVIALAACSSSPSASTDESASDDTIKVGIVLGGLANDGGFNQYAADAAAALEATGDVTADIRESVSNPTDAEPIFRQFASEGYDLIIGWGLGFSDSVFKVAEELPDAHFVATGAADILEKSTDNVETWTYDAAQYGYLSGFIAGKTGLSPVGIVDGELAPFNEYSYEFLKAGLAETNPDAVQLEPIYTGNWEDPQLANQAAKAQIALGAQLIVTASEGYTPGVISAAKEAGIATLGASNASSADASSVNIGLVKLDFTPTLAEIVKRLQDGEYGNASYTSTIGNGGLVWADLNFVDAAPDLPSDIEDQIAELGAKIASGEFVLPTP
ncbi:BMP family ABC transporter substrate-binding protein [Schumannella luteola]|jgi:basic membrane protein A